jgi:hypothetical protein
VPFLIAVRKAARCDDDFIELDFSSVIDQTLKRVRTFLKLNGTLQRPYRSPLANNQKEFVSQKIK